MDYDDITVLIVSNRTIKIQFYTRTYRHSAQIDTVHKNISVTLDEVLNEMSKQPKKRQLIVEVL